MERNKKLTIRLSEEEHSRLKELTEKSEYKSMSEYIRETILYPENKIEVFGIDLNLKKHIEDLNSAYKDCPSYLYINLRNAETSIRRSGDGHYYITFQYENKVECLEGYKKVVSFINSLDDNHKGDIKIIKPLSKKRFMIYSDFDNDNTLQIYKEGENTILGGNVFLK